SPQRGNVALFIEDVAHELRPGVFEDLLLELVQTLLQLLDFGPVVFDHRIDDAVEKGDGALAENLGISRTVIAQLDNRTGRAVMDRHEIVRSKEEVDVVRRETVL